MIKIFKQMRRGPVGISASMFFMLGAAAVLSAGCSSKPGTADVTPYVMNDLGACPLWKISDVSKTDGVADGIQYRVDFTAVLALKDSPSKAWVDASHPGSVASMPVCNMYWIALLQKGGSFPIPEPRLAGLSLSEQYKVTGYAVMVKSENGWRLAKEISGLSFAPIPTN